MLKIGPLQIDPQRLAFAFTLLLAATLTLSRALLSISTGALFVVFLWFLWEKRGKIEKTGLLRLALLCSLLFFIPLLSFFWTQNTPDWLQDAQSKLSFFAIPLAFACLPAFSRKQYLAIFALFSLVQTLVALLSIGGYFLNFEQLTEIVAQNSSIPIFGGINHIYFGYILAFSILLSFHLFRRKTILFSKHDPQIFLSLAIIGVICLHILTSRTGIIAFYGGALAYLLLFVLQEKAYLQGALMLLLLLMIPVISYFIFPSFQNRYKVTVWDSKVYDEKDRKMDHLTVGLRLVAWEAAWEAFLQHPLIGVGPGDVEQELFKRYEAQNLNANRKKWLTSCHNQFLETLMGTGILGFLVLLSVLVVPLVYMKWKPGFLLFSFLATNTVAMLPESILERQIGIAFFTAFLFLILRWEEC